MTVPSFGEIKIIRGQALDIEITAPNEADLTNATVEFGIATSSTSAYQVILPTSISGQVITGFLSETDSLSLAEDEYYYSCWVVIGSYPTPLARGYLKLDSDSRNW